MIVSMERVGAIATLLMILWASLAEAQNQAAAIPPVPPAPAGFVGSNTCKTCHADMWFNFYKNPHFKSIASGKEPPERTGCEGCHGPGQAHVAARGGKSTIPHAFSLMKPKEVLDTCLGCHAIFKKFKNGLKPLLSGFRPL